MTARLLAAGLAQTVDERNQPLPRIPSEVAGFVDGLAALRDEGCG